MDESLFFASHILELSHYCPICVTVIAFTASHQRSLSSSERQRALFIDRHGCHLAAALPVYLNLFICRLASICYSEILLPCQYSCRDGRKRIRVTNVMENWKTLYENKHNSLIVWFQYYFIVHWLLTWTQDLDSWLLVHFLLDISSPNLCT